ncbi:N-6 DNA methylase [Demequina aestuarii]|uniref:N-6 DNA methylase n=1 Tax=Demequina aestuarii TaxID=327095 RepID=UPI00128B6B5A|nr:N-6 DNA methylase [Demequina aestuarii]
MTTPALTFSEYAVALESGEGLPYQIGKVLGVDPTPYQVLRHLVPESERRDRGTFFTSSAMAINLWSGAIETLDAGSVVVDPTCGAGDLLVPAINRIVHDDISDVVIRVRDIDEDLTRIATARLRRAGNSTSTVVDSAACDFLEDISALRDATHVVLNPPFIPMVVAESWASGRVNAAGVFTLRALSAMRPGARLLAVLPDVLRSGSRYAAWRSHVEQLGQINRLEVLEVFDEHTDVHVFLLDVTVGESEHQATWQCDVQQGQTLGDHAEVRVGPVVPHRDAESGPLCTYVTARALTAGVTLKRRFEGRKERGPLVLVNRTTRPGDPKRLRARLWSGAEELAVENHLLVVVPKAGTTCDDLLAVLEGHRAAQFLDERIRCRHLTVASLKEIPWST